MLKNEEEYEFETNNSIYIIIKKRDYVKDIIIYEVRGKEGEFFEQEEEDKVIRIFKSAI